MGDGTQGPPGLQDDAAPKPLLGAMRCEDNWPHDWPWQTVSLKVLQPLHPMCCCPCGDPHMPPTQRRVCVPSLIWWACDNSISDTL